MASRHYGRLWLVRNLPGACRSLGFEKPTPPSKRHFFTEVLAASRDSCLGYAVFRAPHSALYPMTVVPYAMIFEDSRYPLYWCY